jgi:hypothetical protein
LVDQTNGEVLNADKIWLSKAGLNKLDLNNYFSVYPNPATDILTVDFEATNNEDYAVSILDLQGRVISSQNLTALNGAQKVTFDVNNLAKGSYVVTVSSNGMTSTKNVVIK